MRVKLDDVNYNLDLTKLFQFYKLVYTKTRTDGIELSNGQKFVMNSTSVMRTALKMVITPVVLPFLKSIYKDNGVELQPPEKHTDLIDYCVNAFLDLAIQLQEKLDVSFTSHSTSQVGEDSGRSIESVSASWRKSDTQSQPAGLLATPHTQE